MTATTILITEQNGRHMINEKQELAKVLSSFSDHDKEALEKYKKDWTFRKAFNKDNSINRQSELFCQHRKRDIIELLEYGERKGGSQWRGYDYQKLTKEEVIDKYLKEMNDREETPMRRLLALASIAFIERNY